MGVVSVRTDEGPAGHMFLAGPGPGAPLVGEQIVRNLKPVLLGRDPLDIGALWSEMWARRSVDVRAISAIDVALWDIAGKVAGMPVHRLLGTCRDRIRAYASSWVHAAPQDYAEEVGRFQEMGWAGYKLHPLTQRRRFGLEPGLTVAVDIETCDAVRDAAGPDMALMLDAAWAYSYAEALRVGRAIQDLDYAWYEDPLGADDIEGYVRLKQHLWIPVVATEVIDGAHFAYPPWITNRATDALRGDVVLKGGITPLMKIAHAAEVFQLPFEMHDGFHALGNIACLHAALALPNCHWFEVLILDPPGSDGPFDLLSYGLTEPLVVDDGGWVRAPTGPGLGFEPDWDLLRSALVAELR